VKESVWVSALLHPVVPTIEVRGLPVKRLAERGTRTTASVKLSPYLAFCVLS
jgi:hypothetical protein